MNICFLSIFVISSSFYTESSDLENDIEKKTSKHRVAVTKQSILTSCTQSKFAQQLYYSPRGTWDPINRFTHF